MRIFSENYDGLHKKYMTGVSRERARTGRLSSESTTPAKLTSERMIRVSSIPSLQSLHSCSNILFRAFWYLRLFVDAIRRRNVMVALMAVRIAFVS